MVFQPGSMNYTQGFGSSPDSAAFAHIDVRAPAATDILYPISKRWVNTLAGNVYELTSFSVSNGITTANWAFLGSSSGDLNSLTTDDTTIVTPTAGTILFKGTANQVTTTGSNSPGTTTISIPSAFIAPGSIAATTTLTATLGAITATNGNLVLGTAGNKILSSSVGSTTAAGANSFGKVTLSGGTATVSTTAVTASSIIYLTRQSVGATGAAALGQLSIGTITGATSFVINAWSATDATSLATTDVSSIGWFIVN